MKQVLIVDDNKEVRHLLSEAIVSMGYHVLTAGDGDEGLYLFDSHPVDLVLTDFKMPRMNGWSMAYHIKNRSPETPVILLTGSFSEEYRKGLEEDLFDVVLAKPCHLSDIKEKMSLLLTD
jgi:CheY-like chemotaxis protein